MRWDEVDELIRAAVAKEVEEGQKEAFPDSRSG